MSEPRTNGQLAQRRANLAALVDLGVQPYPHTFRSTDTVSSVVKTHGETAGEHLESERPETRVAGRILVIRNFGKAGFLVISDGVFRLQVYVRKDALSERDTDSAT